MRNQARQTLDESGILGRRSARTGYDHTNEQVQRIEAHLDQINRTAAGPDHHRDTLSDAVRQAERDIGLHDRLERWDGHAHTRDAVGQVVDALDTWRDWADGKAIRHDRINHAIDTLNGTQYRPLTDVVDRWADQHQINLRPRPVHAIERDHGISIEI